MMDVGVLPNLSILSLAFSVMTVGFVMKTMVLSQWRRKTMSKQATVAEIALIVRLTLDAASRVDAVDIDALAEHIHWQLKASSVSKPIHALGVFFDGKGGKFYIPMSDGTKVEYELSPEWKTRVHPPTTLLAK